MLYANADKMTDGIVARDLQAHFDVFAIRAVEVVIQPDDVGKEDHIKEAGLQFLGQVNPELERVEIRSGGHPGGARRHAGCVSWYS